MLAMVQVVSTAAAVDPDHGTAGGALQGRRTAPLSSSAGADVDAGLILRLERLLDHLVVAVVALVVIGGATRVMQAGLACPDWPLCYGTLLPGRQMNLQVFLEWFHRLDAFMVGIGLLVLWVVSLWKRTCLPGWLPWAASLSLLLVALQGGLGALTVLQLLAAPTVTAHLLTALLLVLGLSALRQGLVAASAPTPLPAANPLPPWWAALLAFATTALLLQCALGGAMASQWAAERCFQAGEACRWLLNHRLGALPASAALLLTAAASFALPAGSVSLRRFSLSAAALVAVQLALGMFSLRLQLAVPAVTVAHQLVAALLVALMGALLGCSLASPLAEPLVLPAPASSIVEFPHG